MNEKKVYRSYSQLSSYHRCPEAYRLARIEKVPETPAAWLPHGTAVHAAGEAYEKSGRNLNEAEVIQIFKDEYIKDTNKLLDKTPNPGQWFNSGRYEGKEDIERRYLLGQEHVVNYISYYQKHPDEVIWIDNNGNPAIENEFNIELEGVPVRGFIDAVINIGDLLTVVRDTKTGATPGTTEQLTLYSMAVEIENPGIQIDQGDYLMTKTGRVSKPHDVTSGKSRDQLTLDFITMDTAVKNGDFPANPSPENCRRCPVAQSCKFRM